MKLRVDIEGFFINEELPFKGVDIRINPYAIGASHYQIFKMIYALGATGVVLKPSEFEGNYRQMLDFAKLCSDRKLHIAFRLEDEYYDFLKSVGDYSISQTKMDAEQLTKAMMTDASDLSLPIGGTILDYYAKEYFIIENTRTIMIKDSKVFAE